MTNVIPLANPGGVTRQIGDWAETETFKDIIRSLELVRTMEPPAITMIAGAPGVGKTKTLFHFKSTARNVLMHVAVQGEGGVWNLANELCQLLEIDEPNGRRLPEDRRRIAEAFGVGSLLIVDEAQYLVQRNGRGRDDVQAFEWLRGMAEDGWFNLALCGDMELPAFINAMPQLKSRIRRPVIVREASRADVLALVDGTAFASDPAVTALHAVARMPGGLRNVVRVVGSAEIFAGGSAPTLAHLKAAIVSEKLAPKGGA